jgi:gluconate 2-dehydrogenase gamma chain
MSSLYLNEEELALVEAICSRLIPSEPGSPGAKEAEAHIYIDHALGGYFSHLQKYYRQRLQDFSRLAVTLYGAEFHQLSSGDQDDLLRRIEQSEVGEQSETMKLFFEVIYEHTIEGAFGDPLYGGNRDFTGWKLIGFPGAQWGYTSGQMQLNYDSKQIEVLSVTDLLRKHKEVYQGEV